MALKDEHHGGGSNAGDYTPKDARAARSRFPKPPKPPRAKPPKKPNIFGGHVRSWTEAGKPMARPKYSTAGSVDNHHYTRGPKGTLIQHAAAAAARKVHGGGGGGGGRAPKGGGKKGRRGGGGGGGGGSDNGYSTNGIRQQAENLVQGEINKQVRGILDQAKSRKDSMNYDINKANALLNRQKGDLNYVYGETKDFVGGQNQKINDRMAQTQAGIRDIYNHLTGQMSSNTDTNRQAALAEQSRLGIGPVGMDRFSADAANSQNVAAQTNANNEANLAAMANSQGQAGNMLQSMIQGSLQGAINKSLSQNQQNVQDITQQGRLDLNKYYDQINGVRADQGNQVNQLYQQLENQSYQRYADQKQQGFNNAMAAKQFNLSLSEFNSSNFWKQAQLKQQAAQAAALRKQQQQFANSLNNQSSANNRDLATIFNL